MSEVKLTLSENVARAILLDISDKVAGYNEAWAWWTYEASDSVAYPFGSGTASLVQKTTGDFNNTGDTELVFAIELDNEDEPLYYRIAGTYSSYGGDRWNEGTFRAVRPTGRVLRQYEAL